MRLIDADALEKQGWIMHRTVAVNPQTTEMQTKKPTDFPTIIDAVPVVRCKDCKWWTKQEASLQGRCDAYGMYPTGEWYCARGERKDDDKR